MQYVMYVGLHPLWIANVSRDDSRVLVTSLLRQREDAKRGVMQPRHVAMCNVSGIFQTSYAMHKSA
jgi:hypothetical protein